MTALLVVLALVVGLAVGWAVRDSREKPPVSSRVEEIALPVVTERAPVAVISPQPLVWTLVLQSHDGQQSTRTMKQGLPPEYYIRPHGNAKPTKYLRVSAEDYVARYVEVA